MAALYKDDQEVEHIHRNCLSGYAYGGEVMAKNNWKSRMDVFGVFKQSQTEFWVQCFT
jgi:hypothetical protein